jgi:hypothetical protein
VTPQAVARPPSARTVGYAAVRRGVDALLVEPDPAAHLAIAREVVQGIKELLLERYQVRVPPDTQLSACAHHVRATIQEDAVRQHASLDW